MTTTLLMLIVATLAGGLVSLFASRMREGNQHLMVAVSAGLVLGALIFHLVPELFSSTAQSVGDATTGFVIGFLVMLDFLALTVQYFFCYLSVATQKFFFFSP